MNREKALSDAVALHFTTIWDALSLLDGALGHEDLKEPVGAQRLVRMAQEKLLAFDEMISPLI